MSVCGGTKCAGNCCRCWRRNTTRQIIPLLNQFADRARDDEACLERLARDRAHPWRVREGEEERIPVRALSEFPPALARRVLRQMLQMVRGSLQGLTHAHIESLRRFATEAQSGKIQTLPGGMLARKEFSWLVVGPVAARGGRGRVFLSRHHSGRTGGPRTGVFVSF